MTTKGSPNSSTKSSSLSRISVLGSQKSSVLGSSVLGSRLGSTLGSSKLGSLSKTPAKDNKKKANFDFIGSFPLKKDDGKKLENKKQSTGPVFNPGEYKIACRGTELARAIRDDFQEVFVGRYKKDKLEILEVGKSKDHVSAYFKGVPYEHHRKSVTADSFEQLLAGKIDLAVHNMKEIPLELPEGLMIGAALTREDPRDAMVTRATYGAIQELPTNARVGARSQRRIMQIRALRTDVEIIPTPGPLHERLKELDRGALDALIVSWAGLRRLNISPRYYVALQPELMMPAPCQGIIGVVCRVADEELKQKLHYVEDSEASWASRCERSFLLKFGDFGDAPVGANAHRKGTQDPWILDTIIGNPRTGEILRHREVGTSRCKPESLADKAYVGILSKGARKFLPFGS